LQKPQTPIKARAFDFSEFEVKVPTSKKIYRQSALEDTSS
jgi:hypothetical protein